MLKKDPCADESVQGWEDGVEPNEEVGEGVTAPVEGACLFESRLVFKLEGADDTAGRFDFNLAVLAVKDEPNVRAPGFVIKATRLTAFVDEILLVVQKLNDLVLNFFFGSHKKLPRITVFSQKVVLR